jgi:hypothetical protein
MDVQQAANSVPPRSPSRELCANIVDEEAPVPTSPGIYCSQYRMEEYERKNGPLPGTEKVGEWLHDVETAYLPAASSPGNCLNPTLPTAPRNLVATPASARVTLSFDVPADAGGAAITDYVIEQSTAGGAWTTVADGVSGLTSAELTGLVNGTAYAFRVAAVNSAGTSPFSSPVTATPST